MFAIVRSSARALAVLAVFAAGAQAQRKEEKACEVNESRPTNLGKASLAVQIAVTAQTPDAAKKQLVTSMKMLNTLFAKNDNPAGVAFVYGKTLVLWASQPGVGLKAKRSVVGLATNPDADLDLGVEIDSSFKVLETAMPECVSETLKWRGQKPWVEVVNKAIERLNADDADSAAWAAEKAMQLNPFAPYGYVVMANVKQRQNKTSEALALYKKSVDLASRDTSYDDIRRQSLIYLGSLAMDSAEVAADAAARKPYVDEARAAFTAILADKGAGESQPQARQGLCRVAIATGDTASLRVTYKDPMATPASFTYNDLMNAGVCMARAEMKAEAGMLFGAAYEKNPYHRDVLSNLAIVMLQQDQHDKALPLASRLVSLEPNNPENLQLLVLAYAGIAQRTRTARVGARTAAPAPTTTKAGTKAPATKAPVSTAPKLPPAVADSLFKFEAAYTDSAITTNARKDSLPVRVQLSDFSASKDKGTLQGSLILSTNVKAPEGDYTVKVEFLDLKGGVVTSQEAKVAVTSSKVGRFKVEAASPGIAAFRYSVMPPRA